MKKIISSAVIVGLLLGLILTLQAATNTANGCYMCDTPYHYVLFKGTDSNALQKQAYEKYACKVYAVMDSCGIMTNKDQVVSIEGPVQ